jgi:Pentapeptide repeats (8 copies)
MRTQRVPIAAIIIAVIVVVAVAALLGVVLWRGLDAYIDPTSPTEKKDLVQSFAVVVAGVVGSLSALAAVGNLYISRKNLQQQRELELERSDRERALDYERAQEEAVPEYIEQMMRLLSDKEMPLRMSEVDSEVRILARLRTQTTLARLDGSRKAQVIQFLQAARLIRIDMPLVRLAGADLREADLSSANLFRAHLEGVHLEGANLSRTNLERAHLRGAYVTDEPLADANLQGATMPNGQKYEDWLKDREGSKEDGENE